MNRVWNAFFGTWHRTRNTLIGLAIVTAVLAPQFAAQVGVSIADRVAESLVLIWQQAGYAVGVVAAVVLSFWVLLRPAPSKKKKGSGH